MGVFDANRFRERLLGIMDRKNHPAWPHLTRPGLTRAQLTEHLRHEFHTYVRDFPVLLARVLGQGPPGDVRAALAENIYEEQTGGQSLGVPHPELFLEIIDGLGISRAAIESTDGLVPEAGEYRALLDRVSVSPPWVVGAAVMTLFVEGSVHERDEMAGKRTLPPVEEAIAAHPLVKHYGCPPERMRLVRAHRMVEPAHRADAWRMIFGYVGDRGTADLVAASLEAALQSWMRYRDGVARAMGLPERAVQP
jgi:pyrroloquinoline-quinone synthase